MALTKFGENTKSVFLKAIEANKLHQEFEVKAGATVIKGQPLKLAADGTVEPAATDELAFQVIGYSLHNRGAGELLTVAMKPMAIIWSQSAGALAAGPVKILATAPTDPFYRSYVATAHATGADVIGYALDAAVGAGELVRVAIL